MHHLSPRRSLAAFILATSITGITWTTTRSIFTFVAKCTHVVNARAIATQVSYCIVADLMFIQCMIACKVYVVSFDSLDNDLHTYLMFFMSCILYRR